MRKSRIYEGQLHIGEYLAARQGRDDGIRNSAESAGETWMNAAIAAVKKTALEFQEFTADACRKYADDPPEARAWGAVMQQAKRLGYVERTERFQSSGRASCHLCPRRVWRSLICR